MNDLHDRLHRTVKMALDTGEASTLEEAERTFRSYRLALLVGPEVETSPTLQAAVLTAVNTATRAFLGGVTVTGSVDVSLCIPWTQEAATLRDAVVGLGGTVTDAAPDDTPLVCLGTPPPLIPQAHVRLQATFEGWSGGVVPVGTERLPEITENVVSGVLVGALAVSEAFQHVRGYPVAGRRAVGLSLWEPGRDWRDPVIAPGLDWLPSRIWLLGLGHLGQALLWVLGLLPYADPADVDLVLQDDDVLSDANLSTSPLTFPDLLGQKKARAMASWCETRGFRASITERRFSAGLRRAADEPGLLICGVDNAEARAAIEETGFDRVIEAGLGSGALEYLAFQVHAFPGPLRARGRWGTAAPDALQSAADLPEAYRALESDYLDACGLVTLAGRAVGASFVGCAVASLVVSQAIRMARCDGYYGVIDGTLRSPDYIDADEVEPIPSPVSIGFTQGH